MVDGRWTSFGDGKAIPRSPILAFCETTEPGKPKQFWIATRGAGLAKEVGKGWQIITTCCRCARSFGTEINPALHDEAGRLVRGERQVSRLCPGCRASESFDHGRARKGDDAHAES